MNNTLKKIRKEMGVRLYPIGFKFKHLRGKKILRDKTVIDYEATFNSEEKMVRFEYVLEYEFLGQTMRERVIQTTIDIATNNGWENEA